MNVINDTKSDQYQATFQIENNTLSLEYDLKNATVLLTELKLTLDQVWSHGPYAYADHDSKTQNLIFCTTLNLPFIQSPPDPGTIYVVTLQLSDKDRKIHYIEKHQPGQSLYPYGFDYSYLNRYTRCPNKF